MGASEGFEPRASPRRPIPYRSSIKKEGGKRNEHPHMSGFPRRLVAALPGRVRGGLPEVALISMQAAAGARSGARGWRGTGVGGGGGERGEGDAVCVAVGFFHF